MAKTLKSADRYSCRNTVKLVHGGKDFFELLLHLIENAKSSIHLQTYIYQADETGILIAKALMKAAKRKVVVFLLVDGYASQSIPKSLVKELQDSGVNFRFFEPIYRSKHFYFGRRLHHKVFVSDSENALVGGVNISNRYNHLHRNVPWLDFALHLYGEEAKKLCVICRKTWYGFVKKNGVGICEASAPLFTSHSTESVKIRLSRNDWVRKKNEISASYIEMFRNARSHITVISSYFLPGKIIRRLLKKAAGKGVKIKIIIAGKSDVSISKYAERWMYDWLLRNKIEIYEYQPTILHAKASVCDGHWLTLGSYNLNNLSAYASIELNVDVENAGFALEFENVLVSIMENDCVAITQEEHRRNKNVLRQFVRWLSYQAIRAMFFLLTFYYKQER